jgi:hypothetical protein
MRIKTFVLFLAALAFLFGCGPNRQVRKTPIKKPVAKWTGWKKARALIVHKYEEIHGSVLSKGDACVFHIRVKVTWKIQPREKNELIYNGKVRETRYRNTGPTRWYVPTKKTHTVEMETRGDDAKAREIILHKSGSEGKFALYDFQMTVHPLGKCHALPYNDDPDQIEVYINGKYTGTMFIEPRKVRKK